LEDVTRRVFEEGAIGEINPELGIEEQANLLPYDRKWEFPRDRLKLGGFKNTPIKILQSGNTF